MKASDLMIGDWVRVPHIKKTGKVYRIDQANGEGNGFAAVIGGDFNESLLEPIPTTPEILEKNGFKLLGPSDRTVPVVREYADNTWVYDVETDDNFFAQVSVYLGEEGKSVEVYCLDGIVDVKCEYIHQLQHALRLCGIKKEIVL